tara:strand:+ start:2313 stop:2768 length:456 start_codon:yes stop_codon:yes gene_type:complete
MSKEDVKNLLKEIIKTQDPDLIKLATEMLMSSQDDKGPKAPEAQYGDSPPPDATTYSRSDDSEFLSKIKKEKTNGEVAGVPVNKMPRENKFVDHGTEHKDDQNSTPKVELTERKRPAFKKIKQTCTRCGETFETHPQFKRDFYICDRCLKR